MRTKSMDAALVAEVDPERNEGLDPAAIPAGSNRKLWWRCAEHGHTWEATVSSRTRGSRCPFCTNMRVLPGFNDLATKAPDLAGQWHETKNGDLRPEQIGAGTATKVWWHCGVEPSHQWQASVVSRVRGAGCPLCSGRTVVAGVNDLATTHEDITAQHDTRHDPDFDPRKVSSRSTRSTHWRCPVCDHRWRASVRQRVADATCPQCAGTSSLAVADPELAAQWHPVRNGELGPEDVAPSSSRSVWWLCTAHKDGPAHEWQASVNNRHRKHSTCPYCAGKQVLAGFNDLATTRADLAAQWHLTKNGPLTPQDVTSGSARTVWWHCAEHDFDWQATVKARASGSGCPVHAGRVRTPPPDPSSVPPVDLSVQRRQITQALSRLLPDIAIEHCGDDLVLPEHTMRIVPRSVMDDTDRERHHATLRVCQEAGIRLLVVWSDDWARRREVVLAQIAHKLDATSHLDRVLPAVDPLLTERVGARTLTVRELDANTAGTFLDAHHIQGRSAAGLRLGLVDPAGAVRAVLSVRSRGRSEPGTFEIVRYASAGVVAGGFSRLLRAAERRLAGRLERWVTFADCSISDGALYERTGFTAEAELAPDYSYRVGDHREHKFAYRRARFERDELLAFDPALSERQLAELNGLARVWDYGKIRYAKTLG